MSSPIPSGSPQAERLRVRGAVCSTLPEYPGLSTSLPHRQHLRHPILVSSSLTHGDETKVILCYPDGPEVEKTGYEPWALGTGDLMLSGARLPHRLLHGFQFYRVHETFAFKY